MRGCRFGRLTPRRRIGPLKPQTPEQEFQWEPVFPGWALEPAAWTDRSPRTGWHVRYTTVGARPRGSSWPTDDKRLVSGLASVLVASRAKQSELDSDTAFWVTTARRVLQRGTLPEVGARREDIEWNPGVLSALFEPSRPGRRLDRSIQIHDTYEAPFFEEMRRRFPAAAQFVFPQAPFESLSDGGPEPARRWVDFLCAIPGREPFVIEIDGAWKMQSPEEMLNAKQRDEVLEDAGIEVRRIPGMMAHGEVQRLFGGAIDGPRSARDSIGAWTGVLRAARSVYGIIEAVAVGVLAPGSRWRVEIPEGVGDRDVFEELLRLVAALDRLWETGVVPDRIDIGGSDQFTWSNPWPHLGRAAAAGSAAVVRVDWGASWQELDRCDVAVRGVPLPVHPGWDPPVSTERRTLPSATVQDWQHTSGCSASWPSRCSGSRSCGRARPRRFTVS